MIEFPPAPVSRAFHRQFEVAFPPRDLVVDADYLLFASEGAFLLAIERRQWLLPPQRAALIPAHTPITVSATGPATSSSVLFHRGEAGRPETVRIFGVSELARLMIARAMRWGEATPPGPEAGVFFEALGDVVEELAQREEDTSLPRPASAALAKAIACGLADLETDTSYASLAGAGAVSERTLSRLFQEELAMTWSDFRHRARMIRAMQELAGSEAGVTEIGLAVGFDSTSSFIRAFRRFSGSTPHDWRRSVRRR